MAVVAPVCVGKVEAVSCQSSHTGADMWQRTAVHATAMLWQAPLQRQAAQAAQLLKCRRCEHDLLHCRTEHQLQGHHCRKLVKVIRKAEGGRLCQPCPPNATVQMLFWQGEGFKIIWVTRVCECTPRPNAAVASTNELNSRHPSH